MLLQVGLVYPGSSVPFCGGSILSSRTILTAAHCTEGNSASDFEVLVGEHDLTVDDGQERFFVCSKVEHPEYIRSIHSTNIIEILFIDYFKSYLRS